MDKWFIVQYFLQYFQFPITFPSQNVIGALAKSPLKSNYIVPILCCWNPYPDPNTGSPNI